MTNRLIALFILISSICSAQERNSILVSPEWLMERINDENLVIFDIDNEKGYKKGHIPEAQLLLWKEYTFGDETHIFDLPDDQQLKELFENKGVNNESTIVLYVQDNLIPMMTRVYFTLDYLGLSSNTYLLDGGLVQWRASGGETTKDVPGIKKASLNINPNRKLLAGVSYVKENLDEQNVNIVDARASVYFQGIEAGNGGKSRKGHILNAKTVPYTSLFRKAENGAFVFIPLDEMQTIFNAQNLEKDKQIILYCHIGMQLTTVYTAAKMLGYSNLKVYDESFYEWGPNEALPVVLEN